jgi:O-antigen/teichoic acid export membrane protein
MKCQQTIALLKKNKIVMVLLLIAIFGYLSKYALNLILTQYLNPSLYGDFNLALRVLGILSTLSLLGTNTAAKRFLSHFLNEQHDRALQDYIKWNTTIIRRSLIICVVLAVGTYAVLHLLHLWHIKDIRTYHLTIYMLWVAPFAAILSLLNSYLLCANSPISYALIANSSAFITMVLFFAMVMLFEVTDFSSFKLLIVISLSTLCLILIDVYLIMKKSPYLFNHLAHAVKRKQKPKTEPIWVTVSNRLALNGLFCAFIFSLDLIILKLISHHPDATGYYAVVITIASSLFVVPQNIYSSIKAKVSQLMGSSEGQMQLASLIKSLNRVTIVVTLVLTGIILYYSKTLLHHFGVSYVQADPI